MPTAGDGGENTIVEELPTSQTPTTKGDGGGSIIDINEGGFPVIALLAALAVSISVAVISLTLVVGVCVVLRRKRKRVKVHVQGSTTAHLADTGKCENVTTDVDFH